MDIDIDQIDRPTLDFDSMKGICWWENNVLTKGRVNKNMIIYIS